MVKKKFFVGMLCACFLGLGILLGKYAEINSQKYAKGINTQNNHLINQDGLIKDLKKNEVISSGEEEIDELTTEEKEFLERYLYGQWRFAERVIELDRNNNPYIGSEESNISEVGIEELINAVVIDYEEDTVYFPIKIRQGSFTRPQDMYLFAAYGGFSWVDNPIYSIEKMDSDIAILKDIYNAERSHQVQIEGFGDFYHVRYTVLAFKQASTCHGNIFSLFGSDIYIDPADENTIYIDFCGLWRMERDSVNYSTSGKYEY